MPITIVSHDTPRQIMAVAMGEIELDELMAFATDRRHSDHRTWALILDISGATVNLSSADVQQVAKFSAESPIGPVAIIAAEDALFGVGRMFQTYSNISGRQNVGVFRTLDEAQSWLVGKKY